jgi:hypothetical protein
MEPHILGQRVIDLQLPRIKLYFVGHLEFVIQPGRRSNFSRLLTRSIGSPILVRGMVGAEPIKQ